MFIRKKVNPSGVISVQVIDKKGGKYKVIKTIGSSSDALRVEEFVQSGKEWLVSFLGTQDMFAKVLKEEEEQFVVDQLLSKVENVILNGSQLLIDFVFKSVGFNKIPDEIFKHLVIARLSKPLSKLATVDYLKSYYDEDVQLHKIYRYMDKLYKTQQELIQEVSVAHTRKILGGNIGLMFYDVTTLYFETERSDDLREKGFSKDGKHSQPQIVLGLLVSQQGYPLSYSIFNGSQYEGRTLIPIVDDFVHRFKLKDFVIVADSGLANKTNISLLETMGYKYIIGARIKNEHAETKDWILSLEKENNKLNERSLNSQRLNIIYSDTRAKKDNYNREKGIARLEKAYKSGRIKKENINKRGYNKFLEITDDIKVVINSDKIKEDEKWDGLKGYLTNTNLNAAEVYNQYNKLWIIEAAFRVTKGTIELRTMFHFTAKRIEAHICICFVAYKVYKEIERVTKSKGIHLSVDKILDIAKTITTIKVKLSNSKQILTKTMIITPKHKEIEALFDPNFWN